MQSRLDTSETSLRMYPDGRRDSTCQMESITPLDSVRTMLNILYGHTRILETSETMKNKLG